MSSSIQYIIYKTLAFLLQLFGGIAILFVILNITPYDPIGVYIWFEQPFGLEARNKLIRDLRRQWGIDQPIYIQYFKFVYFLLTTGSLGNSWYGPPVSLMLLQTLPYTLILCFISFCFIIPLSTFFGMISANKSNTNFDNYSKIFTSLIYGFPCYILAVLFLFTIEFLKFNFPTTRHRYLFLTVLTVVILVISFSSYQYRLIRKEFIDVLQHNYILTARSKGLKERAILRKHAFKNIRAEIVQSYTSMFPILLSALIVIEIIFGLPGVGSQIVFTVEYLDWGFIAGFGTSILIIIGIVNLINDIVINYFDSYKILKN